MFNSISKYTLVLAALLVIGSFSSVADKRAYVWTYEYQIMEVGAWEVEYYNTISSTDASNFKGNTMVQHMGELEVGMTDWMDFAIYQVFSSSPDMGFNYDGYKLRSRFKIGEKDQFFVDPLIYLEYKGVPDFQKHGIEMKFILAKDFGNFNVSLNPYFEVEKEGADAWEFKPKYAAGICYATSHLMSFGVESKGDKNGIYLGPTLSHGFEHLWVGLSPLFSIGNVTEGKPEFYLRMIVAFGS